MLGCRLSEVLESCMSTSWHSELEFLRIGPIPKLGLVLDTVTANIAP